jgi:uncharacterized membrane protein (DUF4010 family)
MSEYDAFLRLGLALAIGFAFGLERGWQGRDEEEGQRTAGLRTFTLIGLLGGILGALSQAAGGIVFGIGYAATALALAAFMMREGIHEKDYSATSLVAAMLALALGAYAVVGAPAAAAGAAVAAVFFLAYKHILHGWLKRLAWAELRAGLVLAAMTFILLPLLPNRPLDPWSALNPYELWLMTVLIAALSFAGYAAIKITGPQRGTVLAAAAGGLVSSTAVTLSLARMAVDNPRRAGLLAGSILVAGIIMLVRVLVIAGVMNADLALALSPAVVAAIAALGVAAALMIRGERPAPEGGVAFDLENPFELSVALKFGLMLAVIMLLVAIVRQYFHGSALLAIGALSGLMDVDAITLSIARLREVTGEGVQALLLALLVNTVAKAVYAWWAGGRALGARVLLGGLASIAAGASAYFAFQA